MFYKNFLDKFVTVHISVIMICSPSKQMYLHRVQKVLAWENHLCVKEEKCVFHVSRISFLIYYVLIDQDKVMAFTHWPFPTTVKELQRFFWFANFFSRFSTIASPLTSLLKKLKLNPSVNQAFECLKAAFTSAPYLNPLNPPDIS